MREPIRKKEAPTNGSRPVCNRASYPILVLKAAADPAHLRAMCKVNIDIPQISTDLMATHPVTVQREGATTRLPSIKFDILIFSEMELCKHPVTLGN